VQVNDPEYLKHFCSMVLLGLYQGLTHPVEWLCDYERCIAIEHSKISERQEFLNLAWPVMFEAMHLRKPESGEEITAWMESYYAEGVKKIVAKQDPPPETQKHQECCGECDGTGVDTEGDADCTDYSTCPTCRGTGVENVGSESGYNEDGKVACSCCDGFGGFGHQGQGDNVDVDWMQCEACFGTGEAHWKTKGGEIMPFSKMTDDHIKNCVCLLERAMTSLDMFEGYDRDSSSEQATINQLYLEQERRKKPHE
jgi:hypothetical protein